MTRWKFDVDPKDPLVSVRVPATGKWPVLPYLAAFHKDSPHRPTAQEGLMLSSFVEMIKTFGFSSPEQNDMDGEVFDFHPRAVTVIFHKYQRDDWGYRRNSWGEVKGFAPPSPKVATRTIGPLSLAEVMDLVWSDLHGEIDSGWHNWKSRHPEVFG